MFKLYDEHVNLKIAIGLKKVSQALVGKIEALSDTKELRAIIREEINRSLKASQSTAFGSQQEALQSKATSSLWRNRAMQTSIAKKSAATPGAKTSSRVTNSTAKNSSNPGCRSTKKSSHPRNHLVLNVSRAQIQQKSELNNSISNGSTVNYASGLMQSNQLDAQRFKSSRLSRNAKQ